jgi:hypothetical protein
LTLMTNTSSQSLIHITCLLSSLNALISCVL